MGDPWPIVPYNDYLYDFPLSDDFLAFQNDPIRPPDPGPSNEHKASLFPPQQQSDAIFQSHYPNSGQPTQDTSMGHFPHQQCNFEAVQAIQDTPMGHIPPHQERNFEAVQAIYDTPMCHVPPHQERNFEAGQMIQDTPMCHIPPHQERNFEAGQVIIQDTPMCNIPYQECNLEAGQVIQDTPMCHVPRQQCNFEAGPSQLHGQRHPSHQQNAHTQQIPDVAQLSNWPQNALPFLCSCCQVLREIIHTNGSQLEILEIHGKVGEICHGILRHSTNNAGSTGDHRSHMIDFKYSSLEEIKNLIKQYCAEKNAAGYFNLSDPLSAYYEALCVGMEWNEELNDDDFLGTYADNNSGGASEEGDDMDRNTRASLSAQRERAGKMKLSDFSDVFHLPIEEAARLVNLCPTVVKKICRKEGLPRWPHRKLKSIMRKVGILRASLNSADQEAALRARTEAELERLHRDIIQHCGGIMPTSLNFNA